MLANFMWPILYRNYLDHFFFVKDFYKESKKRMQLDNRVLCTLFQKNTQFLHWRLPCTQFFKEPSFFSSLASTLITKNKRLNKTMITEPRKQKKTFSTHIEIDHMLSWSQISDPIRPLFSRTRHLSSEIGSIPNSVEYFMCIDGY